LEKIGRKDFRDLQESIIRILIMRVALFGSFGEGNLGDEAICKATIDNIRKVHENSEIVLFTHDLEDSEKRYDQEFITFRSVIATGFRSLVTQIKNNEFKESINILKKCDLVVIGGGGILYDNEVGIGINPILIWLLRTYLFKLLGLKVVLNAVGVGPITKISSKIYLRLLGNLVNKITVRDKYSQDIMKDCSVYTPIIISADPVWGVKWEERTMKDILQSPKLKYDARSKLGIQVRKVRGMDEAKFVETMAKLIDSMVEKYLLSVVLIPMSFKNTKDILLLEKIQVKAKNESKIEIVKSDNISFISDIMQECDFLIISRLHSIILATQLGIPYIALSYSAKTEDLVNKIKMTDLSWPVTEVDVTTIERLYLKAMKRKVTIKTHLKHMADFMRFEESKNLNLFN